MNAPQGPIHARTSRSRSTYPPVMLMTSNSWVMSAVLASMAEAVKTAGSFDPEKVREALASVDVQTIRGRWKANERGVSADVESVAFKIQNGKRVLVWPEYVSEAKVLPMPKWEDRGKK